MEQRLKIRRASQGSRYSALFTEIKKEYLPWCHGMLFFKDGMTYEKFTDLLEERLFSVGRIRSRFDFDQQGFIEIEEIDKDYHFIKVEESLSVHEISNRYMGDCVNSKNINLDKPLWYVHFFPNMDDGRSLAVISIAHVVGDGVSLVELVFKMMDQEDEIEGETKALRANGKRTKVANIYGPLNKGRIFISGIWQAIASIAAKADSTTPLRRKKKIPSMTKSIAFTPTISLEKVKEIKNKIEGATVNDILISVVNMIIIRYLLNNGLTEKSIKKKKLQAGFPINLRKKNEKILKEDGSPSNKFGIGIFKFFTYYKTRVDLVHKVKGRIDKIKLSPFPMVQSKLGGIINKLQSKKAIAKLLLKVMSQTTCQMSNVPGPQKTVNFGGIEVDDFQFGLYSVMGLYLGLLSYNGKISCCVCMDNTIGEANDLAQYWEEEFNTLYEEIMNIEGISKRPTTWSTFLYKI